MKSNKLKDLMSAEDVRRFGKDCQLSASFLANEVRLFFDDKYKYKLYINYNTQRMRDFIEKYPSLAYLKNTYVCNPNSVSVHLYVDENNHLAIGPVKTEIIIYLMQYYYYKYKSNKGFPAPEFLDDELNEDELFEKTIEYFKAIYEKTSYYIKILEDKINGVFRQIPKNNLFSQAKLNDVRQDRKAIIFLINNLNTFANSYEALKDEFFLENINIDKFELSLVNGACYLLDDEYDKEIEVTEETKEQLVHFIEKYITLIEYLSQRTNEPYEVSIKYQDLQDTYSKIVEWYKELKRKQKDVFEKYHVDITIEDILNNELIDARKKIRREDIENNLQVGWEILPNGNRDNKQIVIKTHSKNRKESMEDSNARDLELLEEKKAFYPNTDYLYCLNGREAYEGYSGFVYKNGLVVLDKFFNKRKDGLVPTHTEGFVVMHILDLIEMSKYTKTELMDLIREGKNKSAQRKYHTSNWQERVQAIIDKPVVDYDFEEINEIIEDVLLKATNQDNSLKK